MHTHMKKRRLFAAIISALAMMLAVLPATTAQAVDYEDYDWDNDAIAFNNVEINDIGAHTANISFDYTIKQDKYKKLQSICFIADVQKIESVQVVEPIQGYAGGYIDYDCQGILDSVVTADDFNNIYGRHNDEEVEIGNGVIKSDFYHFYRYSDSVQEAENWDGKASGHKNLSLTGLQPNTSYGNRNGYDPEPDATGVHPFWKNLAPTAMELARRNETRKVSVDIQQLALGARLVYSDGTVTPFSSVAVRLPDFTTKSLPSGASQGSLGDSTGGNLSYDDGIATAGSPSRIYINNLKAEAKKKVDAGQEAFWYSYIYSDPVALKAPNGAPFVTIKKDDQGRYYYDALIPADYKGEHRIGLQDETGKVQGWTTVSVSDKKSNFKDVVAGKTPHAEHIKWLASQGITTGFEDGTYRGMSPVIRQDMAAFLRREAKIRNIADARNWTPTEQDWKRFKDVNRNTPHAEDILWLAHAGISTGYDNGTFGCTTPVFRQDMAAFLKRMADKANKSSGIPLDGNFTDIKQVAHANEVKWLAGAKITTGYKNSDGTYRFEGMTRVYRQDMAAFLHRLDNLLAK